MPQPALHVRLALETMKRWRAAPAATPALDLDDAAVVNHFLHGALGPDMGLFPGGDGRVSRLTHSWRTGALARALLEAAVNDAERAFAWGWVTHVLADVRVHPLVNAAAAELARDADRPVEPEVGHVRVEVGLDAWFLRQEPSLALRPLDHAFDKHSIAFVRRALQRTYGVAFPPARLLAMHRRVTHFYRLHLKLLRWIARDRQQDAGLGCDRALAAVFGVGGLLIPASAPAYGFLTSVPPTAELVEKVERALIAFHDDVAHHAATRLELLPDYDLETGGIAQSRAPADAARVLAAANVAGFALQAG